MSSSSRKHSLKLVALLTGGVLWFYVLNAARIRLDKSVSLQYILPDNAVFSVRPPSEITVTLEGPRAFMRPIMEREEKLLVDLSKPPWRDNLRPRPTLLARDLLLPFGIRVEKMSPRTLALKLERKASKVLPVRVPLLGELPSELELKDFVVSPASVEVVGPRSLVQSLKEVTTRTLDIESLYGQNAINLDWNLPDERLTVTRSAGPLLSYQLKAKRANLVLENIPIRLLGEGRLVRQQTVTLVLWAPIDVVRRVNKSDLNVQVWAQIPEGSPGPTEVSLRTVLPARLHLVEIRPKRILVEPR